MRENVRVRIAPSPTGFFHVGSARTALYNWLFARHHKGTFILRIEDTDVQRSSAEMEKVILDALTWLGLDWDEGPFLQSERLTIHKKYVEQLIQKKRAYYCYCKPEELEKERKTAYKQKKDWKYDRRCLQLSKEEHEKKQADGIPRAVRFLVPDHAVKFNDVVYGEITREAQDIEDFIIMRATGIPTYNLACVVDDHAMGITHVIRGADHITNTPKQILLYEAFDVTVPAFAHLPLLLGPDKSKLSKRHGAVSLEEYKENGFLSDALVNYLALLGWSPGDDNEIFMDRSSPDSSGTADLKKLTEQFTLERVNKSNAVFDITKLEWMNQQYITHLPSASFKEKLVPFIITSKLMTQEEISKQERWLGAVCELLQPRLKVFSDINTVCRYFFKDDFSYDQSALKKHSDKATLDIMIEFLEVIRSIDPFNANELELRLRNFGEDKDLKVKQWIHPLRVFITGQAGGPGLFDAMEVIGKERCISRIEKVLKARGVDNDEKK